MHQFGSFTTTESKEMKFFCQAVLTFLLGPGEAITPSIEKKPPAKDLAEEKKPSAEALPVQDRTPLAHRLRSHNRPEDPFQGA
jgi:hypothetical protein